MFFIIYTLMFENLEWVIGFSFTLKQLYFFIQHDTLNWSKVIAEALLKIYISNKYCAFLYSSKNSKNVMVFTKILSNTTVLKIDNIKKWFLITESAFKNDFWRIMRHWRLKIQLCHHMNRLHFNYNAISQYYCFANPKYLNHSV